MKPAVESRRTSDSSAEVGRVEELIGVSKNRDGFICDNNSLFHEVIIENEWKLNNSWFYK